LFSFTGAQDCSRQRRCDDIRRLLDQIPILGMLSDNQEQYPPDIDNVYTVTTIEGRAIFGRKGDADAYAEKFTPPGRVVVRKGIFITDETCLLLDADTPIVHLGIPESKEDIRNRALSKLSDAERKSLGL
jgi:hypothetical protein